MAGKMSPPIAANTTRVTAPTVIDKLSVTNGVSQLSITNHIPKTTKKIALIVVIAFSHA